MQPEKKEYILRYLNTFFTPSVHYSEAQINQILKENHTFGDHALLRRELCDAGFLFRTPDGQIYRRNSFAVLPDIWHMERCIAYKPVLADAEHMARIFNTRNAHFQFDPSFYHVQAAECAELITKAHLNPLIDAVQPAPFDLRLIALRENPQNPIGYIHWYYRYPLEKTCFISMMIMQPEYSRTGLGSELIQSFCGQIMDLPDYQEIWLNVYMANLTALSFWTKNGFTHIREVRDIDQERPRMILAYSSVRP